MSDKYILEGHDPVPCGDVIAWASNPNNFKRIAFNHIGPYDVSTVFWGQSYRPEPGGNPVLFETYIFGIDICYQERTCTWNEAVQAHQKAVEHAEGKFQEKIEQADRR